MASESNLMEKIVSLCKQRGFIYQGSELYGGLAGTWDYGPLGVELKNAIKNEWWKVFVTRRSNIYGVDAAILMNPKVWEASGHVEGFNDPLVEDTKTKKRYRADHILEDAGVERAEGLTPEEMTAKIQELGLKTPDGNNFGEVKQFNMMFSTQIGASEDSAQRVYLRPETAGGIFSNFKNVLDTFRPKAPFGIAQIGKAFRNEITPRDFIFRVRELEQMEIEYFVRPVEAANHFLDWKKQWWDWTVALGVDESRMRWYEHSEEERAHYSEGTFDIQFNYSIGWKELCGVANRTDYDLTAHAKTSGQKLEYFDQASGERFVPYVIEPTMGLDRMFLALFESVYTEEELEGGESRIVLKFPPHISPVHVAVLPLMRKDRMPEKARELVALLQKDFKVMYDETASIGKRYRRQDEIGTPLCITVDYDSLEKGTVTVRDRDSMEQETIEIENLPTYLSHKLS